MNSSILHLAMALDKKYQSDYAAYLEECESYRRDGYRPAYCEHGTSMWTDYDNICGPCEEGYSMRDGIFRMAYAISEAKRRYAAAMEIIEFVSMARKRNYRFLDIDAAFEEVHRILTIV